MVMFNVAPVAVWTTLREFRFNFVKLNIDRILEKIGEGPLYHVRIFQVEFCLWNDLDCVGWRVKLYLLTPVEKNMPQTRIRHFSEVVDRRKNVMENELWNRTGMISDTVGNQSYGK